MGRMVALLRAVNVGGRKLPMADLRALCAELGWRDVATYIQSGNIVFSADLAPRAAETALEEAIRRAFAFDAPAIVRAASRWAAYPPANPFPGEPDNRVVMLLAKAPPLDGAVAAIQARARNGERVRAAGDAIWIHYPEGQGTSKLSPALIDRAVGSPATARNLRTIVALQEMLEC